MRIMLFNLLLFTVSAIAIVPTSLADSNNAPTLRVVAQDAHLGYLNRRDSKEHPGKKSVLEDLEEQKEERAVSETRWKRSSRGAEQLSKPAKTLKEDWQHTHIGPGYNFKLSKRASSRPAYEGYITSPPTAPPAYQPHFEEPAPDYNLGVYKHLAPPPNFRARKPPGKKLFGEKSPFDIANPALFKEREAAAKLWHKQIDPLNRAEVTLRDYESRRPRDKREQKSLDRSIEAVREDLSWLYADVRRSESTLKKVNKKEEEFWSYPGPATALQSQLNEAKRLVDHYQLNVNNLKKQRAPRKLYEKEVAKLDVAERQLSTIRSDTSKARESLDKSISHGTENPAREALLEHLDAVDNQIKYLQSGSPTGLSLHYWMLRKEFLVNALKTYPTLPSAVEIESSLDALFVHARNKVRYFQGQVARLERNGPGDDLNSALSNLEYWQLAKKARQASLERFLARYQLPQYSA